MGRHRTGMKTYRYRVNTHNGSSFVNGCVPLAFAFKPAERGFQNTRLLSYRASYHVWASNILASFKHACTTFWSNCLIFWRTLNNVLVFLVFLHSSNKSFITRARFIGIFQNGIHGQNKLANYFVVRKQNLE